MICFITKEISNTLRINQGSNLDKKSTMVIYKVWTINKMTCMNNNPQLKKILNF
jgi:hypothetical protein